MSKCPECLRELSILDGIIYECENCDFMIRISKYEEKFGKPIENWYIELCKDENMWFENAFHEFPSIISHEYFRLYSMLKEGHTYGAMLQIKDLLEVLLKFPTLIVMGHICDREEKSEEEMVLIKATFEKVLSLGDWRELINRIYRKKLINDNVLNPIIKSIRNIFYKETIGENKSDLVRWRNENIGHGALRLEADIIFQSEIIKLLQIIKEHFMKCKDYYLKLKLYIKTDEGEIELKGKELTREIIRDGILFIDNGYIKQKLYPYILIDQGKIYFFDAFVRKYNKISILDYQNGDKKDIVDNNIVKYYYSLYKKSVQVLRNSYNVKLIEKYSEDLEESYLTQSENILNEIQYVNDYKNPDFIEKWLNEKISSCNRGVFLLQMERGMGKTTFSKALDENGYNKIKIKDMTIRSYYVNDSYLSEYGYFYTALSDLFRTDGEGRIIIKEKELKVLSGDPSSMKKDFVELLHGYKEKHERYFGKDKLLLIIDGIDEMANKGDKSIINIIPDKGDLGQGIYILLTCRTNDELSPHILQSLEKLNIPLKNKIIYNRFNDDYLLILREYIEKELKLSNEKDIQIILKKSENRFLYLSTLKTIIEDISTKSIESLPTGEKIFENYLEQLRLCFGDKYFKKIQRILCILASSEEPLTMDEIIYLYGESKITFKFLTYLYQIHSFLKSERTYRGNVLSISHMELKHIILKNYKDIIEELVSEWIGKISNYKVDKDLILRDGESYLMANILAYKDKGIDVDYSPLISEKFSEILIASGENLNKNKFEYYSKIRYFKIYSQLNKIQDLGEGKIEEFKILLFRWVASSKLGDALFENYETSYEVSVKHYELSINSISAILKTHFDLDLKDFLGEDINTEDYHEVQLFLLKKLANSYIDIGRVYYRIGDLGNAKENNQIGIEVYKKSMNNEDENDKMSFASFLLEKARIYNGMGRLGQALEIANRVLEIQENSRILESDEEIQAVISRTEECIGSIYYNLGEVDIAIKNLIKALNTLRGLSSKMQMRNGSFNISVYNKIGSIYAKEKDFQKSVNYFSEAINIYKDMENIGFVYEPMLVIDSYKGIGISYLGLGKYDKSILKLKKSLDLIENETSLINSNIDVYANYICEIYMGLGDSSFLDGVYENSLKYYNEYLYVVMERFNRIFKVASYDLYVTLSRIHISLEKLNRKKEAKIQHEKLEKLKNYYYPHKPYMGPEDLQYVFGDITKPEPTGVANKANSNFPHEYFIVDIDNHEVKECIGMEEPLRSNYSARKKTYTVKFDYKKCEDCHFEQCPSKKKKGTVRFSEKVWIEINNMSV